MGINLFRLKRAFKCVSRGWFREREMRSPGSVARLPCFFDIIPGTWWRRPHNKLLVYAGSRAFGQNQHWKRFIIGARGRNWRRLSNCRLPRKPVLWPRINTSRLDRAQRPNATIITRRISPRQTPPRVRPKHIPRWKPAYWFFALRAFLAHITYVNCSGGYWKKPPINWKLIKSA